MKADFYGDLLANGMCDVQTIKWMTIQCTSTFYPRRWQNGPHVREMVRIESGPLAQGILYSKETQKKKKRMRRKDESQRECEKNKDILFACVC